MTNYKKREITPLLADAMETMPVVVITGMRQVGKSTLLEQEKLFKGMEYYTLDDFAVLEAVRNDPEELLSDRGPVCIDEAQKCPEIFTVIKRLVDKDRTPGRFILSGSANFMLLKEVTESLAGRAIYFELHPFTQREITGSTGTKPFIPEFFTTLKIPGKHKYKKLTSKDILSGGMPSVCLKQVKKPEIWFRGYEQTYLERDMRDLSQVGDLVAFHSLIQLAALRTGQVLNISELGRDAKLNSRTASRYLDLMETSFLIKKLTPYLSNRSSRLIKSPKLYFSDSGLACHLSGIDLDIGHSKHDAQHSTQNYGNGSFPGSMTETYIAQNLSAIIESHLPDGRLHYWHVQGRHEVDFIIEHKRETLAIEIKSAGRWNTHDFAGLKAFLKTTPNCKAAILAYNGTKAVKLEEKIFAIPIGMLLG